MNIFFENHLSGLEEENQELLFSTPSNSQNTELHNEASPIANYFPTPHNTPPHIPEHADIPDDGLESATEQAGDPL